MNVEKLILTLNWLFILFPISIILGNSILNLNFVIFILVGCIYLKKKKIKFKYDFLLILFFIFCIFVSISSIINQFNISKSLLYLRFFVFYFICFYLLKEKIFNLKKIFNYYAIFTFIICTDIIIQSTFGYNIVGIKSYLFGTAKKEVATSFFLDEQVAGSFIQNFGFYLVFIIFYKFNNMKIKNLLIKSFLLSLIHIAIFLSFQRTPLVMWVLFLLIYGMVYYKSRLLPILFSFFIFAIYISSFTSNNLKESYVSYFDNVTGVFGGESIGEKALKNYKIMKDEKIYNKTKKELSKGSSHFESGSGHASLYANTIIIWEDNFVFGVGYKNYYNTCANKKFTRCATHPHNYYLDILVSTGLIGLIILLTFLITIFVKLIYSIRVNLKNFNFEKKDILVISSINFLMHFFPFKSTGSFFTTSNSTYMLIILVILLSQLENSNYKKKN